ncbi:spore germination protein YaaH [Catenulispora sp. MAP12-49]|uniref:glycosyl hydrolase family 18 protein n=1 Tax=Catenulispora sp. MAP12-49 TaxID=3156302 RepID=UPI0035118ECD
MMRRLTAVACTLACLTQASAALAAAKPAEPAGSAHWHSHSGTSAASPQLQAWMYPGTPGSDPACLAQSEYADGRLATGVLKPEFFTISGTRGTVQVESGQCNEDTPSFVADVKAHSAEQFATVSGMTTADVSALVNSSSKRSAAVTKLVNQINAVGFTGIDVDFEDYWSWNSTTLTNYEKFLKQLATALHASGRKLQVDAPAMVADADFYDLAGVAATGVDEVEIMAYDEEYDSTAGQRCLAITPFAWLTSVTQYAQSKIPNPAQLVIGLPSYGYSAPAACDTSQITGNIPNVTMATMPGYSSDPGTIAARRDSGSGEIRWTSGGMLYDYVDSTAMDRKLAVLQGLGVTKVSVWSLGGNPWF